MNPFTLIILSFLVLSIPFQGIGSPPDSSSFNISNAGLDRQRILVGFWDNPALTGGDGPVNFNFQYVSRFSTKHSYTLAQDMRIGKDGKLAIGLVYRHEANGRWNDFYPWKSRFMEDYGYLTSSYKLEFGEHIIRPGISLGFASRKVDFEQLIFGDMIDPGKGFINDSQESQVHVTRSGFSMSLGLEYVHKNYYIEVALQHVAEPQAGFIPTGFTRVPRELLLHTGLRLRNIARHVFIPYLIYRRNYYRGTVTPGILTELGPKFFVGLSYNNLNTITVNTGVNINKKLRIIASGGVMTHQRLRKFSLFGYSKIAITYFMKDKKGG